MIKGQSRYRNEAIYFTPEPVNKYEEFRPITEQIVPDIQPYYLISNFGRLYHKYKKRFLNNNIDSKGYLYKPLALKSGKSKACRIHRLVMMVFNYVPGCENLIVNHKDGNKCNPHLSNLEWTTARENILHAVNTGLRYNIKFNEDEDCIGTISEPINEPEDMNPIQQPYQMAQPISIEQVEEICQILQDTDLTIDQVSEKTGVAYHVVSAIQGKRTWCSISDKYNIKQRRIPSNLTIDQVHLLCKYFQDVKRPDNISIRQYCRDGLECIGIPDCSWLQLRSALKILNKDTYKHVSIEYNF